MIITGGEALTTVSAFAGGAYAMHRFRSVPKGRERETLKAMQELYAESAALRRSVLTNIAPLVRQGREACLEAAHAAGAECPAEVRRALEEWPQPTGTAAHEILASDAKIRSLLWAVKRVQQVRDGQLEEDGANKQIIDDVEKLVVKLNNFAQVVELGLFEQSDVFGLLHRSIAPACKAIEPVIWARCASEGRWGMRLIRLRIRAEHFNDVRTVHSSSPLTWSMPNYATVTIHEPLRQSVFDRTVPSRRMTNMSTRERAWIGWESHVSTRARRHFGGVRLRRHIAAENKLIGEIQYALQHRLDPLRFDWSVAALRAGLRDHHEGRA